MADKTSADPTVEGKEGTVFCMSEMSKNSLYTEMI
jgi:hypothetical protein